MLAGAQTQPWAITSQSSNPVTVGVLTGPLAMDSLGDLAVANSLVSVSAPSKVFGDTSAGFNFVSKMNPSGDFLFGVEIGGVSSIDAVAVDSAGSVLLAGNGVSAGLPVAPNAYSSIPSGPNPTFACKLKAADGTPIFCTYLNSDQISISGIGADASGNVFVLAIDLTQSVATTRGALSLGSRDVVLLKLDPVGQKLVYAAAFGGNGTEGLINLSVDADGNAYVMGETSSTNFPGAASGAIPTPSGAFIAKVDPTGTKILWASYGRPGDVPQALTVDKSGAAYVSGTNFPGAANSGEFYVRKYTPDGAAMAYETVLAGANSNVLGAAVDSTGDLTIVGNAFSYAFPQHSSIEPCPALNVPYPANSPGNYMVRLAADGKVLQSTFFPAQLVDVPASGGSVLATQPNSGLLAISTGNGTSAGVLKLGPDLDPLPPAGLGCVVNAGSFLPGSIAPGEIVSIFGSGLGPATAQSWTLGPSDSVATMLAGVQVTFDGTPAPILYVKDTQINAITPWELAGKSTTEMCVLYNGNSQCETPSVGGAAPGVFITGQDSAIAVNQDGTLNSKTNPAQAGSIVTLYVTGLGAISPVPADGAMVRFPLPALANSIQVAFANAGTNAPAIPPAELLYAGPAPLEVGGMYQVNVRIPEGTTGEFAILSQFADGNTYFCTSTLAVTPQPAGASGSDPVIKRAPRLKVR